MHVERIHTTDELLRFADQWPTLTRGIPFRGWQWLASWWEHYQSGGELYFLAVFGSDGSWQGAAPWYLSRSAAQGRVIRLLGSGEICSDYLSLLATPENEDAVAAAISQWLVNDAPRESDNAWDLLELNGIDRDDQAIKHLVEKLTDAGCRSHARAGANCWRIALPSSWDEYVSSLSKSHRKQVNRAEKRLADGGHAVVRVAATADEVAQGMRILVDLHQRRWRSLNRPGCFASRSFSGFLHAAANRLFDAGMLRLHWIELDGRPIAAEFHLVSAGVTYNYQAGIDPDALADEPGRMMHVAAIKEAIETGQRAFDFLRGDEPYKAHWRAEPRPSVEYRIAAKHSAAQIRHGIWLAGSAVKDLIKSSLGFVGAS